MNIEEERDFLRKELVAREAMIAMILHVQGDATIEKKLFVEGVISGKMVEIDETDDAFVLKLVDNDTV
jgi:hypothetical protein